MTAEAKADAWKDYRSPAPHEVKNGSDLTNPGLPLLNAEDEYVFQLDRVNLKTGVISDFKKDEPQDRFYTVWKEEKTGNVIMIAFRVDKLVYNNKSPKFQSPVLTFFQKIGQGIPEGTEPNWGNLFVIGMRIRARVLPKLLSGKPTGTYAIELATARRYQQ